MDVNWLRDFPIFSDFSDEELERLLSAFQKKVFPAGSILLREDEPGDRFCLILRGEVEVIKALGTEEEWQVATVGPGDFLGEMSLLDPSGLHSASARAVGLVEWVELTSQAFSDLLQRQPTLTFHLVKEMNLRLRRSETATIRDLQAKNKALTQAYLDLHRAQAALIEKEKLEREMEIARDIQKRILPKQIPELKGWQISAHWEPAMAVGGDFYDFLPHPDGRLGLLIADVTGKGVSAALVMATTCSVLRAVSEAGVSPGAVLQRVNGLLHPYMPRNMFVTCFYGLLDPSTGVFHYANAGHNLPLISNAGYVQELHARGMPLGLMPEMVYEEKEARLQPGDGLLLYTDGIVEAHNPDRDMFGMPRLRDCLAEISCNSETIDTLLAHLAAFTGPEWEQEDDVTFVVLACL
jgi:serine phosphatase RsbU (regulator of sigma subunit)